MQIDRDMRLPGTGNEQLALNLTLHPKLSLKAGNRLQSTRQILLSPRLLKKLARLSHQITQAIHQRRRAYTLPITPRFGKLRRKTRGHVPVNGRLRKIKGGSNLSHTLATKQGGSNGIDTLVPAD
jgi:hypothetical protein